MPIPGVSYQSNYKGHQELSESLLDGAALFSPPPELLKTCVKLYINEPMISRMYCQAIIKDQVISNKEGLTSKTAKKIGIDF